MNNIVSAVKARKIAQHAWAGIIWATKPALVVHRIASTAQTRMNASSVKRDFQFFKVFVFFERKKGKKEKKEYCLIILVNFHIKTQMDESPFLKSLTFFSVWFISIKKSLPRKDRYIIRFLLTILSFYTNPMFF